MRTLKLIEFLYLALYVVISSQLLYYLLVMSDALRLTSVDNFMELRKAIDPIFKKRLSAVYYGCLILNIALLIMQRKNFASISYATWVIAFLCLVADLVIAVKGNIPINNQISTYTTGSTTHNWLQLKNDWLYYITWRGIANATGILSLLAGFIALKK